MLKYLLLTPAICFLFSKNIAAQNDASNAVLKEQIRKLDLAHAQAIFKSDALALDSLMSDEVTVNHPTNKIVKEKKELMEMIHNGVIRYAAFARIPETFLFFEDMVIVMGREEVVPAKGAPNAGKNLQRRYTNMWMKKNNKWQLYVRHANNVCSQ